MYLLKSLTQADAGTPKLHYAIPLRTPLSDLVSKVYLVSLNENQITRIMKVLLLERMTSSAIVKHCSFSGTAVVSGSGRRCQPSSTRFVVCVGLRLRPSSCMILCVAFICQH
jgi:hypothetical protein